MSLAGNENDVNNNDNANDFIFIMKESKLYVPVITLAARENQKLQKFLSKGFKRSVYWSECKTKSYNQNTTN